MESDFPVSVIVTAYRSQDFVGECLDSIYDVMSSWTGDWELIIGVDGCKPTRREVMSYPLGANASVYWFDENYGTYPVSNTLLSLRHHPVFVRFDSDDIMLPPFSIYLSGVNDCEVLRFPYRSFTKDGDGRTHIRSGNVQYTCGVVAISPPVLDRVGGYRDWRCAADTDLMHRATLAKCKVTKPDDVFGLAMLRRRHDAALTYMADTGGRSDLRRGYKQIMWATTDPYIEPKTVPCCRLA